MIYEPLLPKTTECIQKIENVFKNRMELWKKGSTYQESEELWDSISDEEKYLFNNPMLHLAEVICDETNSDNEGGWAVDLAKFILTITHYNMK